VSLAAVQCADALLASLNTLCYDDEPSTPAILSSELIARVNESIKGLSAADVPGVCVCQFDSIIYESSDEMFEYINDFDGTPIKVLHFFGKLQPSNTR
jgi:hypothetical protein